MNAKIDLSKDYGIVFEGGGAKGAYQIGVWKALKEYGVKITGVAGTSVGALNGALLCMGDLERAEEIWKNISYSQVMQVNDDTMERLIKRDIKLANITELSKDMFKILLDGGFDVNPLKKMIDSVVDEKKIQESEVEFFLSTFSLSERKEIDISAREIDPGLIKDYLLASAYLPLFKNEKLHGKKYLDGGIVNDIPVDMLIKRGYKNIIVVRIFGIGIEKRVKIPSDVSVIEIEPYVNLGSILEFNSKKSARNMKIGYYDALRHILSLEGKRYYIKPSGEEDCYLMKFMYMNEAVKMALLEFYKQDFSNADLYLRQWLEIVLPKLASDMRLPKDWTYKQLYFQVLEYCARCLRIFVYKVYTEDELVKKIGDKFVGSHFEEELGVFTKILIKSIIL